MDQEIRLSFYRQRMSRCIAQKGKGAVSVWPAGKCNNNPFADDLISSSIMMRGPAYEK